MTDNKKNIVAFAQPSEQTTPFRHGQPLSEEVMDTFLPETYNDFVSFIVQRVGEVYRPLLMEFVEDHDPPEDKRLALELNLFWWRVLYDVSEIENVSFVEDFCMEYKQDLKQTPLMKAWLEEWEKASPKFYYIGHKFGANAFVAVDMETEETVEVVMIDRRVKEPEKGSIAVGTLIPMGNALYFPVTGFYYFDPEVSKELARPLMYHYEKHMEASPVLEGFVHVLSIALQIERMILEKTTPSSLS
ncbi:hypothetical protein ACJA3J_21090 [Halobacillus sp. SY10]|uniref:Uncharacterized protein n=2 Tax=Halobacillus TaxID=45667 RepID=A0A1H0EIY8_HALAD|nr:MULTISPECIES: hypothetical protein [Halobacillus]RDY71390.1 hypothetical protein DXT76_08050 [Halobacillus trueperi]SDN82295.1 hypothetical protein SAMN05421677_101208 [Halobacillus aidingensis]